MGEDFEKLEQKQKSGLQLTEKDNNYEYGNE